MSLHERTWRAKGRGDTMSLHGRTWRAKGRNENKKIEKSVGTPSPTLSAFGGEPLVKKHLLQVAGIGAWNAHSTHYWQASKLKALGHHGTYQKIKK